MVTKNKRSSDKDVANEMLNMFRAEMPNWSNGSALILWLARAKRTVQRRVLDALKGPPKKGAPKRPISDDLILEGVEGYRDLLESYPGHGERKLTDLAVIQLWLENTGTRFNRAPGKAFKKDTSSGKAEIRFVRDACVRAKRSRKKAVN